MHVYCECEFLLSVFLSWLFEEWPGFGGSAHTPKMTPGDKRRVRDPENQRLREVCQSFTSNQSFKLDLQMPLVLSGESGKLWNICKVCVNLMTYFHLTTSKCHKCKTLINVSKWGIKLARRFWSWALTTHCLWKMVVSSLLWDIN